MFLNPKGNLGREYGESSDDEVGSQLVDLARSQIMVLNTFYCLAFEESDQR